MSHVVAIGQQMDTPRNSGVAIGQRVGTQEIKMPRVWNATQCPKKTIRKESHIIGQQMNTIRNTKVLVGRHQVTDSLDDGSSGTSISLLEHTECRLRSPFSVGQ